MSAVKSTGAAHDWQAFTPATCRVAAVELALVKDIAEVKEGDFFLVSDAWKATLVPQGCVVIHKRSDATKAYFSLLPTAAGVLAWPCDRVGQSHIRLAGRGAVPFWAQVFDLSEHYILPATVRSPLHCFLDCVPLHDVGILVAHELPVKLVQYQARWGSAGVPETSMKLLSGELGHEAPEQDAQSEVPQDVAWAAELISILMTRVCVDQNICESLMSDVYRCDALQDCMRAQDKKAMRDILQSTAKAAERRKQLSEGIHHLVSKPIRKQEGGETGEEHSSEHRHEGCGALREGRAPLVEQCEGRHGLHRQVAAARRVLRQGPGQWPLPHRVPWPPARPLHLDGAGCGSGVCTSTQEVVAVAYRCHRGAVPVA